MFKQQTTQKTTHKTKDSALVVTGELVGCFLFKLKIF